MKLREKIYILAAIAGVIASLFTVLTYYQANKSNKIQSTEGVNSPIYSDINGGVKINEN